MRGKPELIPIDSHFQVQDNKVQGNKEQGYKVQSSKVQGLLTTIKSIKIINKQKNVCFAQKIDNIRFKPEMRRRMKIIPPYLKSADPITQV